jgi:ABC-2 type transport system permease protein
MFIMIYAGQVMRGVIEEKTSRVVEILVSSVKPFQLMMGKIIGIGLVGLTQFLIWIGLISLLLFLMRIFVFQDVFDPATLANMQALNNGDVGALTGDGMMASKSSAFIELIYYDIQWPVLLILFLLYFIGGYLLYGSLFAVVGSAVDSETDTQQVMLPVMMPLFFSYIVAVMIMGNPNGPAAIWFSQIPFSSPIIMLQRVAAGTVGLWEVILSLLILIVTFLIALWGASKIYRVGILMYGKKASWKEIFKWMRY